jgi:hypothetical protein
MPGKKGPAATDRSGLRLHWTVSILAEPDAALPEGR